METEVKGGSDYLELKIEVKGKIQEDCVLEVVLYLHDGVRGDREYSKDVFEGVFERVIRMQPLPEKSMFKVVTMLSNGGQKVKNTIYAFTKSKVTEEEEEEFEERFEERPRSSSIVNHNRMRESQERLVRGPKQPANSVLKEKKFEQPYSVCTTQEMMYSLGRIHKIQGDKKLQKTILAARKARNIEEFIKPEKGLRPETRDERFQRTMLFSHGLQFFNEVYSYKPGNKLFQNDWFMGPFYSYNGNQKQMRKK